MAFNPQTGMTVASVSTNDREKFLAAKLLERSYLKLVCASVCDKVSQPKGTGTTAYFVRYKRMNVPLTTLTEGTPPSNSTYSLEQVTVTLDQWGDVITITDIAKLTTKHPLWQQAMELLLDNAQRLIDREVQTVWLAGTNVLLGDGSKTTRADIENSHTLTQALLHQTRINLVNAGTPTRDGPTNMKQNAKGGAATGNLHGGGHYVIVCGPEPVADIMSIASATGLWAAVSQYQHAKNVYNAEVGTFLGFRIVETNFIPKFTILGNTTAAVVSGNAFGTDTPVVTAVDGGGTLTSSTTYYYKVTRKSLLRGFEEDISIIHSTASTAAGNDESFTFNFSSLTAGYVYNLYFGTSNSNAAMKLVQENIAVGTTVTVTAESASTTTPPTNLKTDGSVSAVHPLYVMGKSFCAWVGLQDLQTYITGDKPEKSDPINQVQTMGYKFMGKTVILDQNRLLRLEVASAYS